MTSDRIHTDHPLFSDFLRHLIADEDYKAYDLIYVIDHPWRWQSEFDEFLEQRRTAIAAKENHDATQ